jgi:RNA polymerase sigma-70 factor (ECF subfamily)
MGRVQDKATIGTWILQAKGGNQDAFSMLVETYYPSLFRLVFQIVPQRQDAEDILQETFFRFFQAIRRVDPGQDPFPFLKTIAVRRTCSFLSSDRRRHVSLDELPEDLPELAVLGLTLGVRTLYSWAQTLPPAQRLVFLLREVLGVADQEIARMSGLREITVRRHASLARQALERRFG